MKPTYLCIGVQKGGTTSLINYLNIHPEIYMLFGELHFFDKNYNDGIENYEKNFKTSKKIIGEKTPIYCYDKKSIDRIYNHYPNIKLIIFLREPISRAYSQWNMYQTLIKNHPNTNKSFIDCINSDLQQNIDIQNESDILQRGYYYNQIKYILNIFPKKNLYIGISEEIKKNKNLEYNKIYKFLGASGGIQIKQNLDNHIGFYNSKIKIEDAQFLYKIYKPHIEKLYTLLGRRIESWDNYYSTIN
jgi:hypothetical protein